MDVSIERLREDLRMFPGAAALYRIKGNVMEALYFSPRLATVLDMDAGEYAAAIQHDAMDIVLPADRPYVLKMLGQCLSGQTEELDIHYRAIRKSTGFEWVHVRAKVAGTVDRDPVLVAFFTNSTAESDLYQDIINHTGSMVYVCDRESYEILYANQAARKYRQQNAKPLFGMPCYAYIHKKAAPCEDCFMKRMKAGENLSLTRYNAERKTWEHLRGEFIDWCGHPAFVQYIDDVTKSETLHRELENAEKRLEMVMDATGLSAWEYDSKRHTITYANSVFQNYGLPAVTEDVPQSLIPFVVPEDRPKLLELYQQLEEGRTPLSGDFQFLNRKTGSSSYLHTVYITTQDIDGEPVTYGACIDVTAQIQERKNYRSNVSALLEANPESLCAFQLNLTRNECIEGHGVSAFILEALRANTADAVLENIRNLIPSESERGVFAEKFDRVRLIKRFEQGIRLDHLDYRRCNEAQKIIWVRTFLNLLKDPETNEINCIIYSADITGQEETNCVLRIITGQEYQLVSIVDIESRSVTAKFIGEKVPEAYRRFYSKAGDCFPAEALRTFIAGSWLLPEDAAAYLAGTDITALRRRMSADEHFEFTVRARSAENNGEITYHRFQHYWLDESHEKILVVMSDVTGSVLHQQAELEKERSLLKQANAANAAKTDFLSRMSHDMRTPLNVILGLTHLSLKREHTAQTADELRKIDTVSKFLLGLINEVLDVSAMESGHLELHPEPYVSDDFLAYMEAFARPLCEEKGQRLVLDLQPVAGCVPLMDKLRANQVLFNLLSNAAKFTPEGGTITVRLREKMTPAGRLSVTVVIEDTGVGMTEEFQHHIFEPFVQEDRDDVSLKRGTGLGLSIVKQLTDLMGGRIGIRSAPGKGTAFTLTFEFDCVPSEAPGLAKQPPAADTRPLLTGRHILLCEDHPLNQEIACALLREKGILVDVADNGETGVQKFCRSVPEFYDAILMDLRMPVMDGLEATRQIRAASRPDAKTVPIVAMTADVYADEMKNCMDIGMNGHIAKPIDPEKMYAILASLIG